VYSLHSFFIIIIDLFFVMFDRLSYLKYVLKYVIFFSNKTYYNKIYNNFIFFKIRQIIKHNNNKKSTVTTKKNEDIHPEKYLFIN
jgi:hypothetical protein